MMKHSEICGDGELVEIHRESLANSYKVVRWCPNCGAVVVDEDYEGRTRPGAYVKMKFPKMVGTRVAIELATGVRVPRDLSIKDQDTILEDVGRRTRDIVQENGPDGGVG